MFTGRARSPVVDMAYTRDLILQAYLVELTRLRALSPELIVDELEGISPLWAPVKVSSSIS